MKVEGERERGNFVEKVPVSENRFSPRASGAVLEFPSILIFLLYMLTCDSGSSGETRCTTPLK